MQKANRSNQSRVCNNYKKLINLMNYKEVWVLLMKFARSKEWKVISLLNYELASLFYIPKYSGRDSNQEGKK